MEGPAVTALDCLRRETRFHQCVSDADRIALTGRPPTLTGYVSYLAKMYGYEAPLESALSVAPDLAKHLDVSNRMKAATLGTDLVALGFPPANLLALPVCAFEPLRSLPQALGWLFVSEKNRTGHQLFRTYLSHELPAVLDGSTPGITRTSADDWRQFERVLEGIVTRDSRALDKVIEAAIEAYDCQHYWFCPGILSGTQMQHGQRIAQERLRTRPRSTRRSAD